MSIHSISFLIISDSMLFLFDLKKPKIWRKSLKKHAKLKKLKLKYKS